MHWRLYENAGVYFLSIIFPKPNFGQCVKIIPSLEAVEYCLQLSVHNTFCLTKPVPSCFSAQDSLIIPIHFSLTELRCTEPWTSVFSLPYLDVCFITAAGRWRIDYRTRCLGPALDVSSRIAEKLPLS